LRSCGARIPPMTQRRAARKSGVNAAPAYHPAFCNQIMRLHERIPQKDFGEIY
jgi:predicted dehydrogenase